MNRLSQRVLRHIRTKWKSGCPVCGAKKFSEPLRVDLVVGDAVARGTWAGLGPPRAWLPCAAFACLNCGYTMMLNAQLAGLEDVIDEGEHE